MEKNFSKLGKTLRAATLGAGMTLAAAAPAEATDELPTKADTLKNTLGPEEMGRLKEPLSQILTQLGSAVDELENGLRGIRILKIR